MAHKVRLLIGSLAIAILVSACGSSSGSSSPTTAAPTTTVPAVPKTSSDLFVSGTVKIAAGEPGKLSIVHVGKPRGSYGATVPVVVRNNTKESLERVTVEGTIKAPDGSLVASGDSDPTIEPVVVNPGEYAVGYIYFSTSPPAGSTYDLTVSGNKLSGHSFLSSIPVKVAKANVSKDSFGDVSVVGTVVNETADEVKGPISVTVVCFENNEPTVADQTFTRADDLAAGASSSFTADFYSDASPSNCSSFVAGASGYNF